MHELITTGILYFTSFISLINPFSIMPVYMAMTRDLNKDDAKRTLRKASIVAFSTLILFAFTGQLMFKLFGISVNSFRIVGGIIFFLMGMDMLQARLVKVKLNESEVRSYVNDISITPLAIPLITGPGAITNSIVLMEDSNTLELKIILFTAIFLVILLNFIILSSSSKILRIIGDTGKNVMMRLMGLIVMVIAVEFFFSGLKPIIIDIAKMIK